MIIIGPLWFLNLILIGLNLILITFINVINKKIDIDSSLQKTNIEKNVPNINPSNMNPIPNQDIFNRDIFNTTTQKQTESNIFIFQPKNLVDIILPPTKPQPIPTQTSIFKEKDLLPPLQIILRGTIISDKPLNNKAFIENVRTKEEKDYIVGDIVEDAQIVHINKYKATFIRSNGQEEIIYLNKLLKIEDESISNTSWDEVIKVNTENIKVINLDLFYYKIKTLSAFIDQLNLITLFEKNIPIGCLVQYSGKDSLANALGLEENDIIISINDILVNDTQMRMQIYELILNNKNDQNFLISVKIKRNDLIIPLFFKLKKNKTKNKKRTMGMLKINELQKET